MKNLISTYLSWDSDYQYVTAQNETETGEDSNK
jgi:hypothetical protein